MNDLPTSVLSARAKADAAADAQLAVWDRLPAIPSHDDITEWIAAREKFQAAQPKFFTVAVEVASQATISIADNYVAIHNAEMMR